MPVARQQIPNTHKRTNLVSVFSTRSVRQLCAAIIELLEAGFSMRSVSKCFKQGSFKVWLVVRQLPASKSVNTEV
jgi:hypothetical protein